MIIMAKTRENKKEVLEILNNADLLNQMMDVLTKSWKNSEKKIKEYIKDKVFELEEL